MLSLISDICYCRKLYRTLAMEVCRKNLSDPASEEYIQHVKELREKIYQKKKNMKAKEMTKEETMSRTSREVEQLINDIRDPNLDCSLDDIAAMIDDNEKKPESRGSPEFRTAASMIDQVS